MVSLNGKRLILASSSPRRAQILKLLALDFEIIDSQFNEDEETYTMPEVHVLNLAQKKALKVAESISDGLVVGADTIVVVENRILGKPANKREAKSMLRDLSGKRHTVYTGFALIDRPSGSMVNEYEKTDVYFRDLSDEEIKTYVETESPLDKAGAYGIQDMSAVFVNRVDGCFYNVMGFPITRFYIALRAFLN